MSTQNENVARFARNVEWLFFGFSNTVLYKMAHLVKRNADYNSDFSAKFHFYQNNDFLFVFRVFHDDWQSKQKQSTQNHLDLDGIYYLLWRSRVQGKTSYLKNATDFEMFLSCTVVQISRNVSWSKIMSEASNFTIWSWPFLASDRKLIRF